MSNINDKDKLASTPSADSRHDYINSQSVGHNSSDEFEVETFPIVGCEHQRVIVRWLKHSSDFRGEANLANPKERDKLIDQIAGHFGLEEGKLDQVREALASASDSKSAVSPVRNMQKSTSTDTLDDTDRKSEKKISSQLVGLVKDAELFHDPDGNPYINVKVGRHKEVHSIDEKFKQYLQAEYYRGKKKPVSDNALSEAIDNLAAQARFGAAERQVYLRCAKLDEKIYIDLCNKFRQVVEIDENGWRIIDDSPVHFRRTKSMSELPTPVLGGDIEELRKLLNITDEDWKLLKGWLVAALNPLGPHPILSVQGEQGSAKSTTCEMIKSLVDPDTVPLRTMPKNTQNLALASYNGWCLAYDNISTIPPEISDSLCRITTGAGFATRMLYTDVDETIIKAQRPIILNGIVDIATRSDLLARCIVFNLSTISPASRKTEKELEQEFEAIKAAVFGAILTAVSEALKNYPVVNLAELPRMADFAKWATAAEPALGLKDGEFIEAYEGNRKQSNEAILEDSPLTKPIERLIEKQPNLEWSGSATELLEELNLLVDEQTKQSKEWPKSASPLGRKLKKIAPNLRLAGFDVEDGKSASGNKRQWKLSKKDENLLSDVSVPSEDRYAPNDPTKDEPEYLRGEQPSEARESLDKTYQQDYFEEDDWGEV